MELWDLYRLDGTPTGMTVQKGKDFPPGMYNLLVHIIICNQENKFLVQQRSFRKEHFPGIWDITGGRVQAGETSRQGAVREAVEEVGLRFEETQLIHIAHTVTQWNSLFDIYFVQASFTLSDCTPQKEEVERLDLLSYSETVSRLNKDTWYNGVLADVARRIGVLS